MYIYILGSSVDMRLQKIIMKKNKKKKHAIASHLKRYVKVERNLVDTFSTSI